MAQGCEKNSILVSGKVENVVHQSFDFNVQTLTRQVILFFIGRYDLYTHRDESGFLPLTLPPADFKDFVDIGPVTWDSFSKLCS
jgi:hypothetical protein